ncbi:MAG TPA: acetate--CoA ligase, partial [Candidatus Limnocylindrales bacterium]
ELGIQKGDRVAIYMPMIPELPIAMLACARIGAPHTVVFGGFSSEALAGRINDAQAKLVITADGGWRRGKPAELKPAVDEAVTETPTIEHVLVVRRLGHKAATAMQDGRDLWWHDIVDRQSAACPPTPVDSEHMLYLLYTSGSTAKPKGIFHTTAGYLLGTSYTHEMIFDLKPDDVYWCAADIGWVTGHSYIVYGPLANAATGVMYEGTPDTPAWDRWWQIIEDYKVSILYCAPTAIRAFMKQGKEWPDKHDLTSLRVLGSVGEPINPEAWLWYRLNIGGDRAPVVDTWWQTETGMILISPLPGVTTTKPGSATFPFPGIAADVVDGQGNSVPLGGGGYLVLKRPWPAMLRGIYGDPERYRETYWSRFPGMYFAGDGAKRDEEGYYWLLGRVDDVMNVSGHRLSTTEIESALVSHPAVAEAAVVGGPDPVSGEAIIAFVILRKEFEPTKELGEELRKHVATKISPIAKPKTLMFTPDLPKTRSGKIMRRLLRDIAQGRALGDTTTLADASVVDTIRANSGKAEE